MDKIHSAFITADELLKNYVYQNDKFEQRYIAMIKDINKFIESSNLKDKVKLNVLSLGYLLVDYFEDVRRLKNFHNVKHINSIKIVAYMSHWLLKRKPIQLLSQDKDVLYVNERFVLAYILDYLSSDDKGLILLRENKGLDSFSESLFYFLKYRAVDANSIELMLLSFCAGRIYQETNKDLSDVLLNKYDN